MKILEKVALNVFSLIILVISVIAIFLRFNWLNASAVYTAMQAALNNEVGANIILGVSIVCILLAIKVIFFGSSSEYDEKKEGVLLENSEGKLLISKTTIENLVNRVVAGFDSAAEVETKIVLDEENNVTVYVQLAVKENAVIKELSNNLQLKIKESIKKASDLDVKEVNISIKDIEMESQNIKE